MADKEKTVDKATEKPAKQSAKPKKETKDKEIERLKIELEAEKNQVLRVAAEFDNYKRRTEKEKLAAAEYNAAKLLGKLLPIFDNVDRANAADKESPDYAKGVELIVKMLTEATTDLGLIVIGAEGETFDPNLHEAVMHIENEAFGENVICQVLQKGYKIGETVIRPAMVKVAN